MLWPNLNFTVFPYFWNQMFLLKPLKSTKNSNAFPEKHMKTHWKPFVQHHVLQLSHITVAEERDFFADILPSGEHMCFECEILSYRAVINRRLSRKRRGGWGGQKSAGLIHRIVAVGMSAPDMHVTRIQTLPAPLCASRWHVILHGCTDVAAQ